MSNSTIHRSTYTSYPYLTKEEFAEACHYLDRRYSRATLGPVRKRWRLHVHTALELSFEDRSGYTTFLQITRPLDDGKADDNDLAAKMGDVSLTEDNEVDHVMTEMEDADTEVLFKPPSRPNFQGGHVKYEIHLHPTYRAPCLWFSLHNLPAGESALDAETVFRHLVPEQFKTSLRQMGPIGGISIDVGEIFLRCSTSQCVVSCTGYFYCLYLLTKCDVYSITP
ncbi:hypothetical protein M426DRAFT_214655 [Hypoxylon sp. CI-4A]|nr:hypothetical protein M426DRAFT_214655 [Hypoxylon sp. CI-4A]